MDQADQIHQILDLIAKKAGNDIQKPLMNGDDIPGCTNWKEALTSNGVLEVIASVTARETCFEDWV